MAISGGTVAMQSLLSVSMNLLVFVLLAAILILWVRSSRES